MSNEDWHDMAIELNRRFMGAGCVGGKTELAAKSDRIILGGVPDGMMEVELG
jgi:hypothetical protein